MSTRKNIRNILVTTALPYANAPLHLGHILEHTQSDIWVRYQRLIGNRCVFVCADDAHGTPIMLKANELNIEPETLIKEMYQNHVNTFNLYNISHDNYHTTHSKENQILSERIFNSLNNNGLIESKKIEQLFDTAKKMFLSDRYVRGACPKCSAKDQYGDNCEVCGSTYEATELIEPISVLTNTKPIIKESEHLFFKLSTLKRKIVNWLRNSRIQTPVHNKLEEWLKEELKDWDISRDSPYFGFEIPGFKNKYFYVWLDAPIGYLASHMNYLNKQKSDKFEEFWDKGSNSEIYHFIGKDIVYFHTLFFPAMLAESDFKTPSGVFVHGFLTLEGQKMSKSRGNFISAEEFISVIDAEYLRYYFASKLSTGVDDIDLNLEDLRQKVNSDLVNKFVNIASRSAKFINNDFNSQLSKNVDEDLLDEFIKTSEDISLMYENLELSKVVKELMKLADKANQYVDKMQPWILIKEEKNADLVHQICSTAINLFRILAIMLQPITPQLAEKAYSFLNDDPDWNSIHKPLVEHKINKFTPLILRLEENQIDQLMEFKNA
tara:strand:+ start:5286 stop:6935 length:1650 start_codon:yes stop_codon:yes gene_type:complete